MKTFFEIITWFFFFLSILVWLFLLRWEIMFSGDVYDLIKTIMIPWYLIVTWLMVWCFIANIWSKQAADPSKVYSKSFIIGILSWVILALAYMFL